MVFGRNIQKIEFACFSFHVGLLVITLSSLKLHTENNACMLCASVSCWARLFLQHLRRRTLWIIRQTDDQWIHAAREISLTTRWFWRLTSWLSNSDSTVSTLSSVYAHCVCRCPEACRLFQLRQQPVDAVLRPTFVQKLCYKLPSAVIFIFIHTSNVLTVGALAIPKAKAIVTCSLSSQSLFWHVNAMLMLLFELGYCVQNVSFWVQEKTVFLKIWRFLGLKWILCLELYWVFKTITIIKYFNTTVWTSVIIYIMQLVFVLTVTWFLSLHCWNTGIFSLYTQKCYWLTTAMERLWIIL